MSSIVVPKEDLQSQPQLEKKFNLSVIKPQLDRFSGRLEHIDGLRAIACISVFLMHAWMQAERPEVRFKIHGLFINPLRILMFGNTGVHLFLLLSGFCLFFAFARPDGYQRYSTKTFAVKRIWRIVPAYFASLALFLMVPFILPALGTALGRHYITQPFPTGKSIVLHLLLLHGLSPDAFQDINGVFWSLSLEWQLYFTFPVLVWAFHTRGPFVTVMFVAFVTVFWRILAYRIWGVSDVHVAWVATSNFLGRWIEFVLGMFAAWQLYHGSPSRNPKRYFLVFVAFFVAFAVIASRTASFTPLNDSLWGCAYFFLLKCALLDGSPVHRLVSFPPLVAIGGISYSVYLLHMLPLQLIAPLLTRFSPPVRLAFLIPTAGILSLLAAAGFFNYFERPFIKVRSALNGSANRR